MSIASGPVRSSPTAPAVPYLSDAFARFDRYLQIVLADSAELLDLAFRLCFQVYCLERGFEDATQFADGRERDQDDARSVHTLLVARNSGAAIGTVRLILPRRDAELPVFRVVGSGKRRTAGLPFEATAEVSRFAVAKSFRRDFETDRGTDTTHGSARAKAQHEAWQLLTFGLIRSVVVMTACAGVTHIVGMMEPALLRLLRRLGIIFHRLGEPVEYHGLRQPSWAVMAELIAGIERTCPELGAIIADGEAPGSPTPRYVRA